MIKSPQSWHQISISNLIKFKFEQRVQCVYYRTIFGSSLEYPAFTCVKFRATRKRISTV